MVHPAAERDPGSLPEGEKPGQPGRRSAGSGGNHRGRENQSPHGPRILRPAVSRQRLRKAGKKRPVDGKEALPRRAVERPRRSASDHGQRDREGSDRHPGPGPAPSHRFAPHRGLARVVIDQAVNRESGRDQAARCPAILRVLLHQGDALPGARLLRFAPRQEDRRQEDRDQEDLDQGDPDQDPDPDDRVDKPVPLAPAIRAAGRLGLCPPEMATARQHIHPLSPPPGRRNRGSAQARPQPGQVADRALNQQAGLAENRAGNQASHRPTSSGANQRAKSQEHDREPKLAAGGCD
jgi:hypothetical protein